MRFPVEIKLGTALLVVLVVALGTTATERLENIKDEAERALEEALARQGAAHRVETALLEAEISRRSSPGAFEEHRKRFLQALEDPALTFPGGEASARLGGIRELGAAYSPSGTGYEDLLDAVHAFEEFAARALRGTAGERRLGSEHLGIGLVFFLGAAVVAVTLAFGAWLVREVERPLERTADVFAEFRKGNLHRRLPESGASEFVAAIQRGINELADELQVLRAAAGKAEALHQAALDGFLEREERPCAVIGADGRLVAANSKLRGLLSPREELIAGLLERERARGAVAEMPLGRRGGAEVGRIVWLEAAEH